MSNIQDFLNAKTFAVAGASRDRNKYGNRVFRALLEAGRQVVPLNPTAGMVEGHNAYASIKAVSPAPEALSIVTPPMVTRQIIVEAISAGVKHVWMQPGAEDAEGSAAARAAGLNVIDDGSCILVLLSIERRKG
ncbi:MAG: CoA-binding protein [Pirellulaceae bacterium]